MKKFAELFKKYRLRAEFETIAAFNDALADKGYHYEESIFSHWQKGTRIPSNRQLLITMLAIFVEKDAIKTMQEANEFIVSTGQGYLTEKEAAVINLHLPHNAPFQVPSEIAYFTGREEVVKTIQKEIICGQVFLLYGSPGVGKTALAIKLGHLLRNQFPDGVLWYKVDSSNVMDILLSIARLYGEDISGIKDVEVRASIVRALLSKKKVLLIFDNITKQEKLHLLLPNSVSCSVIFSSQESMLNISTAYTPIALHGFTQEEVVALFQKIFDINYVTKNKKIIFAISEKLGNLPLAVHLAAAHLKESRLLPQTYLSQLGAESFDLQILKYEDKNLFRAITINFQTLDSQEKTVFISLGVFEGTDFSLDAVAFINKLSVDVAKQILKQLQNISFIEPSSNKRYRIHPLMRTFARKQIDSSVYLRAAFYYEQALNAAEEKRSYKSLTQEVDNIIFVFKRCYDFGYWDQIITLWNPIEKFLSDTNEIKKLRSLAQTIDTIPSINNFQKIIIGYFVFVFIYWIVLQFSGLKIGFWNYLYNTAFGLPPLIGGLVGVFRSKSWGLFKTNVGKAVFFISAGLLSWSIGNLIFSYYNFAKNIDAPYPSLADIGYSPAYFFWIAGMIYLSRATGAKFALKEKREKIFLLVVPLIIITLSYYFLLFIVKRTFVSDTPVKIFFDLYYPSMDIFILTIATIILGLSVNFFKGKYRVSLVVILAGFVFSFLGDMFFSYTTSIDTYFTGGVVDLLFTIALFLLTLGTLSFYLTPRKK